MRSATDTAEFIAENPLRIVQRKVPQSTSFFRIRHLQDRVLCGLVTQSGSVWCGPGRGFSLRRSAGLAGIWSGEKLQKIANQGNLSSDFGHRLFRFLRTLTCAHFSINERDRRIAR